MSLYCQINVTETKQKRQLDTKKWITLTHLIFDKAPPTGLDTGTRTATRETLTYLALSTVGNAKGCKINLKSSEFDQSFEQL